MLKKGYLIIALIFSLLVLNSFAPGNCSGKPLDSDSLKCYTASSCKDIHRGRQSINVNGIAREFVFTLPETMTRQSLIL